MAGSLMILLDVSADGGSETFRIGWKRVGRYWLPMKVDQTTGGEESTYRMSALKVKPRKK